MDAKPSTASERSAGTGLLDPNTQTARWRHRPDPPSSRWPTSRLSRLEKRRGSRPPTIRPAFARHSDDPTAHTW
jgi:hypothetical protein